MRTSTNVLSHTVGSVQRPTCASGIPPHSPHMAKCGRTRTSCMHAPAHARMCVCVTERDQTARRAPFHSQLARTVHPLRPIFRLHPLCISSGLHCSSSTALRAPPNLPCRTSDPVHSCSPATAPMHTNTNVLPRAIANVQPAACAHPCAAAHVYDRAHVLHPRTSTHTPHARKKLHRTHTSALGSNFIPLAPFTVHLTGPIHRSRS